MNVIKRSIEEFKSLKYFGNEFHLTTELFEMCEKFICRLYWWKSNINNINMLRYKIFCKKPRKNERLPPCQDSLIQHLKRANYQCAIWKLSLIPKPIIPSPIENGWKLDEKGVLVPFLGNQSAPPIEIVELAVCGCTTSKCEKKNCKCSKNGLKCTPACNCEGSDELCNNEFNNIDLEIDSDDSDLEES